MSTARQLEVRRDDGAADRASLVLGGRWRLEGDIPDAAEALAQVRGLGTVTGIGFVAETLENWDSSLLIFLRRFEGAAGVAGLVVDRAGLPEGARRLLTLAEAVPSEDDAHGAAPHPDLLTRVGLDVEREAGAFVDVVRFVGEVTLALGALVRGRARFRRVDLELALENTGVRALPIVGLISVLVGMILAFIGAIQLTQFGAEIYVSNLVAIGMLREMGAMMAAIIMAGRTGASFAAELGTMQVNEEIDALTTTSLSPVEFLVLPRLLALVVMMPLLAIYADMLGVIGGAVVGIGVLEIRPALYFDQSLRFIGPLDIFAGILKAFIFAFVVALAGCYYGIRAGRSSAAVGAATTAAVVMGIVGIVVTDALLTVIFNVVGL